MDLSVIMPVYNGERYIRKTLMSVLSQTYEDFRLIVVNDASTDKSMDIIASFTDTRICVLENKKNIGQTASLNRGLNSCTTKYVAIHDQDDISRPDRFEKQLDFLRRNTCVALVGTFGNLIDENGHIIRVLKLPTEDQAIRIAFLFQGPICHSSVMFKKDIIVTELGSYDEHFKIIQDYDLWARLLEKHRITNLPESLVDHRIHRNSSGIKNKELFVREREVIGKRYFKFFLKRTPTLEEQQLMLSLSCGIQTGLGAWGAMSAINNIVDSLLSIYPNIIDQTESSSEISKYYYLVADHFAQNRAVSLCACLKWKKLSPPCCRLRKTAKLLALWGGGAEIRKLLR